MSTGDFKERLLGELADRIDRESDTADIVVSPVYSTLFASGLRMAPAYKYLRRRMTATAGTSAIQRCLYSVRAFRSAPHQYAVS